MAVIKIENIAVRSWGNNSVTQKDKIVAVLAINVAKTGGGDVDIAT